LIIALTTQNENMQQHIIVMQGSILQMQLQIHNMQAQLQAKLQVQPPNILYMQEPALNPNEVEFPEQITEKNKFNLDAQFDNYVARSAANLQLHNHRKYANKSPSEIVLSDHINSAIKKPYKKYVKPE
jgi:hypothetical protein